MKRGITLLYIFLISLSFIPYFLEKQNRLEILQKLSGFIIFPFKVFSNNILEYTRFREENDYLKKELAMAKLELERLKVFKKENEELKKILRFSIEKAFFIEPLQIISINEEGGNRIYICKKKSLNIISKYAPVVGYEGLIGKVKEVSGDFIIVQSIKHTNNFISVMDIKTGIKGIMKWDGNFVIEGIPTYENVEIGDTIVTSGMGGVYPKGINVGTVKEIRRSKKEFEMEIIVEPFEKNRFYDQVFVLVLQ